MLHKSRLRRLRLPAQRQWLKIIDADNYDKGWMYASEYLKNAVPKDSFKQTLQGVRSPLGSMKNRVLAASEYTTSLPGSPDGEYVVMKYKTEFAKKSEPALRPVISKKEDGQWKVADIISSRNNAANSTGRGIRDGLEC